MDGHATPRRALRLIFSYESGQVRLVSRQPVEMIVPPSDPPLQAETHAGFWYELKDAADATLYRRLAHDPIPTSTEVFSNERGTGNLRRVPHAPASGVFTVVLPDVPEARFVTLASRPVESPAVARAAAQRPVEIARFDLRA